MRIGLMEFHVKLPFPQGQLLKLPFPSRIFGTHPLVAMQHLPAMMAMEASHLPLAKHQLLPAPMVRQAFHGGIRNWFRLIVA